MAKKKVKTTNEKFLEAVVDGDNLKAMKLQVQMIAERQANATDLEHKEFASLSTTYRQLVADINRLENPDTFNEQKEQNILYDGVESFREFLTEILEKE